MFNEIGLIRQVDHVPSKLSLLLLFLGEYNQWLQHLKSIGLAWGKDGEENAAQKEINRTVAHIALLEQEVSDIAIQQPTGGEA